MIEKQLPLVPEFVGTPPKSLTPLVLGSFTAEADYKSPPHPAIRPVPADSGVAAKKRSARTFPITPVASTCLVKRYNVAHKPAWDKFVSTAKNATFLFSRDYMDYHRDRFTDHSLLIFQNEVLVAVLPANVMTDGSLISHEGLTYGGLVVSRSATLVEVLTFFHALLQDLSRRQIPMLRYKQFPGFYDTRPDGDVAYALFMLEARLYRRDCAAVVVQSERLPFRKGHQSLIKKAIKLGVEIVEETTFQPFLEKVLAPRLAARYGTKPVHTLAELTGLAAHFPEQIRQFSAYCGDEIVAGTTIYETPTVAHAQYAAVTDRGRQMGAQAYLFSTLIDQYQDKRFFDFGTSNENEGRALNQGLLDWKEGFGARCYAHDYYEIVTGNYLKLEPLLWSLRDTRSPSSPSDQGSSLTDSARLGHPETALTEPASEEGEILCRQPAAASVAAA